MCAQTRLADGGMTVLQHAKILIDKQCLYFRRIASHPPFSKDPLLERLRPFPRIHGEN